MASVPLWVRLSCTAVVAACLTGLSLTGYHYWTKSNLFNPNPPRFAPLYFENQWFAYLTFCYCAPVAFALIFAVAQVCMRYFADKTALLYYLVTTGTAGVLAYLAFMGASLMIPFWQCGFVFCVNSEVRQFHIT